MGTNIYIHIGAPRTATTTLQKHVFPKLKNTYLYSKLAYETSGISSRESTAIAENANEYSLDSIRKDFSRVNNNSDRTDFLRRYIINPSLYSSQEGSEGNNQDKQIKILASAVKLLCSSGKDSLISSERLCDSSASLYCFSAHQGGVKRCLPVHPLCQAINNAGATPLINICLREPIQYLRSKYLRTCILRKDHLNQRELSPKEFIFKQATLETESPGTSALAQAMHSSFVAQLQKTAFVKAFGFKELVTSEDIFTLMGIQGEDKVNFQSFPKENTINTSIETQENIETEIKLALEKCGYYRRLQSEKMYD